MANNRQFIADVEKFRTLTKDKMLRVAKQSIQDTIRIAQTTGAKGGDMPVDTSFLRNSLVVELNSAEKARSNPEAGEDSSTGLDSVVLGLSSLQLGDIMSVSWVAKYAVKRHYLVNANGGLWRDKAAQQWQRIVEKNAKAVR